MDINESQQGENNKKKCKICKHFCPYMYEYYDNGYKDNLPSEYGECRRFPPKPLLSDDAIFPVVGEFMWCGEFDNLT